MSSIISTLDDINFYVYVYVGLTELVIGTIGNALTVILFGQAPLRATRSALTIIVLAILNTIYLDFAITLRVMAGIRRQNDTTFGSDVLCRFFLFVLYGCATTIVGLLVCIAHRQVSVLLPTSLETCVEHQEGLAHSHCSHPSDCHVAQYAVPYSRKERGHQSCNGRHGMHDPQSGSHTLLGKKFPFAETPKSHFPSPYETGLLSSACTDNVATLAVALDLRLTDHQEHSHCQTSLESSRTANDSNPPFANHGGHLLSRAIRLEFAVSRTATRK